MAQHITKPEEILAAVYRHPDNAGDTTIWHQPMIMGYTDGFTRFRIESVAGDVEEVLLIQKREDGTYQIAVDENY